MWIVSGATLAPPKDLIRFSSFGSLVSPLSATNGAFARPISTTWWAFVPPLPAATSAARPASVMMIWVAMCDQ
ncbi:hypothetical protein [Burkholderia cenocepacia]|uniref:hypothetical protein n=1 Tax=Burkholderia cenocepacia TaxID=95486 RepID=UPI002653D95F|nr:hypothetical protein [Burkholderia cenocepacia]MDN7455982.1 hypothetical protein [Burkholderia cenocepacia]